MNALALNNSVITGAFTLNTGGALSSTNVVSAIFNSASAVVPILTTAPGPTYVSAASMNLTVANGGIGTLNTIFNIRVPGTTTVNIANPVAGSLQYGFINNFNVLGGLVRTDPPTGMVVYNGFGAAPGFDGAGSNLLFGAPIPQDVEPYLFEPFFSTRSRGTGLGLYICRELCERYGASIDYRLLPAGSLQRNEFFVAMRRQVLTDSEARMNLSH